MFPLITKIEMLSQERAGAAIEVAKLGTSLLFPVLTRYFACGICIQGCQNVKIPSLCGSPSS